MSRPRILHLIHHLRVGGAEQLLVDLLPRLADDGLEAHVACLDDRGPLFDVLRNRGIPGHFIGRRRGFDPAAIWRLRALLRDLRIDILNTHAFSAGLWGRLAALTAPAPKVVATFHSVAGWSQPRKQYACNRLLQPATDRFVAVSESVRRSLVDKEDMRPESIQVIHNGIVAERFFRSTDQPRDRRRLGLPRDGFIVGMVARCSPEKGGAFWVKAMGDLCRAHPEVCGVLVGDGPQRAAWEAIAAREAIAAKGTAARIRFAGAQTDVAPWLAVLDALVCPSIQESFGLVALEAQAAGVPVVATRVDGFLDVLHDGEDALLVPADDPAAIAAAVESLMGSPNLARALTAAGRRNAVRYTIARTAEQYGILYRGLLAPE